MALSSISIHKVRQGFTLIEVIVVLGIFAILAALGLFLSMDFYRGYSFRSEQKILVSILEKARSQALSNINQARHGVYIEPGKYTIFEGNAWAGPNPSLDEEIKASSSVTISASPPLPLEVVFEQLSGDEVGLGGDKTITLMFGSQSLTITINNEGRINWN